MSHGKQIHSFTTLRTEHQVRDFSDLSPVTAAAQITIKVRKQLTHKASTEFGNLAVSSAS